MNSKKYNKTATATFKAFTPQNAQTVTIPKVVEKSTVDEEGWTLVKKQNKNNNDHKNNRNNNRNYDRNYEQKNYNKNYPPIAKVKPLMVFTSGPIIVPEPIPAPVIVQEPVPVTVIVPEPAPAPIIVPESVHETIIVPEPEPVPVNVIIPEPVPIPEVIQNNSGSTTPEPSLTPNVSELSSSVNSDSEENPFISVRKTNNRERRSNSNNITIIPTVERNRKEQNPEKTCATDNHVYVNAPIDSEAMEKYILDIAKESGYSVTVFVNMPRDPHGKILGTGYIFIKGSKEFVYKLCNLDKDGKPRIESSIDPEFEDMDLEMAQMYYESIKESNTEEDKKMCENLKIIIDSEGQKKPMKETYLAPEVNIPPIICNNEQKAIMIKVYEHLKETNNLTAEINAYEKFVPTFRLTSCHSPLTTDFYSRFYQFNVFNRNADNLSTTDVKKHILRFTSCSENDVVVKYGKYKNKKCFIVELNDETTDGAFFLKYARRTYVNRVELEFSHIPIV